MLKRFIPKCRNCIHLLEKTQFCNRYNVPTVEARLDYKLCSVKAVGKITNHIDIDVREELKKEYLDKCNKLRNASVGYFALSFTNFYFFYCSIPELYSIIFATLSGGFIRMGYYYIEERNYYYDKTKQVENKSFLTNNTKTSQESNHK